MSPSWRTPANEVAGGYVLRPKANNGLREAGHDVDFAREWDHIAEDDEILQVAHSQQRVVITRDKDFGTLAVRDRQPSCGIIRLVELPPGRELDLCLFVLANHRDDLAIGALITVEAHRIRIRHPLEGPADSN